MEDQLISGETAKLAKEKGFNINCKEKFYHLAGEFQMQYGSGKYWEDEEGKEWQEEELYARTKGIGKRTVLNEYSRPTQSLLQKWLREMHNIEAFVRIEPLNRKYSHTIYNRNISNYNESIYYFKTYEEALDSSLLTALERI